MLMFKETHAIGWCPRCKSGQLDSWFTPDFDDSRVFEHFKCMNCGAEVTQIYKYEKSYAEWEEG